MIKAHIQINWQHTFEIVVSFPDHTQFVNVRFVVYVHCMYNILNEDHVLTSVKFTAKIRESMCKLSNTFVLVTVLLNFAMNEFIDSSE